MRPGRTWLGPGRTQWSGAAPGPVGPSPVDTGSHQLGPGPHAPRDCQFFEGLRFKSRRPLAQDSFKNLGAVRHVHHRAKRPHGHAILWSPGQGLMNHATQTVSRPQRQWTIRNGMLLQVVHAGQVHEIRAGGARLVVTVGGSQDEPHSVLELSDLERAWGLGCL